jgi:hypothetical protein
MSGKDNGEGNKDLTPKDSPEDREQIEKVRKKGSLDNPVMKKAWEEQQKKKRKGKGR